MGFLIVNLDSFYKDETVLVSQASEISNDNTIQDNHFDVISETIDAKLVNSNISYFKTPQAYEGDALTESLVSEAMSLKDNVIYYTVQENDDIKSIASLFNVSEDSIRWANNLESDDLYKGVEIIVPTVSGVVHTLQIDESIEFLANIYNVSIESIYNANRVVYDGAKIVIPGARPVPISDEIIGYKGIQIGEYFIMPVKGFNWGRLHNNNAVDIAGVCETPIVAAADGVVIEEKEGYNGGYGNYIVIEHTNGTETLYAHNTENIATVGSIVYQGEVIGTLGNTGNVHGVTGCHLHFEVHGTENPFEAK